MRPVPIVLILAAALGAISCSSTPPAAEPPQAPAASAAMAPPGTAEPTAEDKAKLAALETDYNTAKAAFQKAPKDDAARKTFIKQAVLFGHESMISPVLPARVKYKQALGVYREVLKIDPDNEVAKKETDLIVGIYKSMGRPVPEG